LNYNLVNKSRDIIEKIVYWFKNDFLKNPVQYITIFFGAIILIGLMLKSLEVLL